MDDNLIEELTYVENELISNENAVGGQKLKVLSLKRNPICQSENFIRKIKETSFGKVVLFE